MKELIDNNWDKRVYIDEDYVMIIFHNKYEFKETLT